MSHPNCGVAGWNKGMRGVNGFSETRFKDGNMPQTWRPIGSERVDRDVLYRKVCDTRSKSDWKAVHVILWDERNGPVPTGHIVVFNDRDNRNFAHENLLLVTRAENMKRNSYHKYPQPIPQLIQLRGALNRQINKREKDHQK